MGSIVKSLHVQKRTYISYNFDTKLGFLKIVTKSTEYRIKHYY